MPKREYYQALVSKKVRFTERHFDGQIKPDRWAKMANRVMGVLIGSEKPLTPKKILSRYKAAGHHKNIVPYEEELKELLIKLTNMKYIKKKN